eukprot:15072.XXX_798166_798368_1 [CDS] Oithona nana genome sequencing.
MLWIFAIIQLIRGRDASNAIIIMPCSSLFVKELLIRRNATRLALPASHCNFYGSLFGR